jgi:protein disulfide-isomerase-like protein
MSSKNNVSKASASMFSGKGKNYWASIGLVVLIIAVVIAYYYVSKSNREGFEGGAPNLTPANGEVVVVLFKTEWCGHCKTTKPEYEKATSALNGKKNSSGKTIRFEKVDCDENKELGKEFGVSGYPTIKILNDDGSQDDYDGARSFEGLKKYLMSDN